MPKPSDTELISDIRRLKTLPGTKNYGYRRLAKILSDRYNCSINTKRIYRIMDENDLFDREKKIKPEKITISNDLKKRTIYALRNYKESRRYTWEDIAEILGVTKLTVIRWNKKRKSKPQISPKNLIKIVELLDESIYRVYVSRELRLRLNELNDKGKR